MKRQMRKIILTMIFTFLLLALTACSAGSTINTTMTINKDFSGTRQMTIAISNDVFSEYFHGTIEDLNNLIDTTHPAELDWQYSEDDGIKKYIFIGGFVHDCG